MHRYMLYIYIYICVYKYTKRTEQESICISHPLLLAYVTKSASNPMKLPAVITNAYTRAPKLHNETLDEYPNDTNTCKYIHDRAFPETYIYIHILLHFFFFVGPFS